MSEAGPDREVIDVIRSGFHKLVDEAVAKWWSGKYGSDNDVTKSNIRRWRAIEARGDELIVTLSHQVKTEVGS